MFSGKIRRMYAKSTDLQCMNKSLMQTKRVEVREEGAIKIYIIATYLNSINHKLVEINSKIDRFIVSVYISDESEHKLYKDIEFFVDKKRAHRVKILKNRNPILNIIPNLNSWSRYYEIESFADTKNKLSTIEFKVGTKKTETLSFNKYFF